MAKRSFSSQSSVVNIDDIRRRKVEQRHSVRRDLVRSLLRETDCDVRDLYDASVAETVSASLAIADRISPIGEHDGSDCAHLDCEHAADFIAALAWDTLNSERAGDPTFDRGKVYGQCLDEARRIVASLEQAAFQGPPNTGLK